MPRGLKPVTKRLASGQTRTYWYHRASGRALAHDPRTAAGMLEVAALDARAEALLTVQAIAAGTLASLWADYIRSPEWRGLKPRTRSDYQAVRDWLGEAAAKAVLRTITARQVLALRDKAFAAKGRRFGNYVVQVLRMLFGWGRLRGLIDANPATGVPGIRRPSGARQVNRAWSADEIAAFARACPIQLLVPFALALFASMRQGDALIVTRRAYDGHMVRWVAGKNGEAQAVAVTGIFKAILDLATQRWQASPAAAVQLALTSAGTPWTASGFRASFFKRVRALQGAGLIRPGASFHGLRHTIGTMASNDGESDRRVAAAIGDRSAAMAQIYARDAERHGAQASILDSIQQRFENLDWKPPALSLETASDKRPPKAGKSP